MFPLATPLIAGPGAIGASILLVADAQRDPVRIAIVIAAMLAVVLLTYLLLLAATQVQKLLGVTGLQVVIARHGRAAGGAGRPVPVRRHRRQRPASAAARLSRWRGRR